MAENSSNHPGVSNAGSCFSTLFSQKLVAYLHRKPDVIQAAEPNISIVSIDEINRQAWDDVWRSCCHGTYFQSPEWHEIWSAYTSGRMRPTPLQFGFSDGKRAIVPISVERQCGGLMQTAWSSPAGTYGGWISLDEITDVHGTLIEDLMCHRFPSLIWRRNPHDPRQRGMCSAHLRMDYTHVVPLSSDPEMLGRMAKPSCLRNARKAERDGLRVRRAVALADWESYLRIYSESLRRWGAEATSRYDPSLFIDMFRRRSKSIQLWLAEKEGTILSGALMLYSRNHAIYWHGANADISRGSGSANILFLSIMSDAMERGIAVFDFNPSGGHRGVEAFKESFGAVRVECPMLVQHGFVRKFVYTALRCLRASGIRTGGRRP